MGSIRARLILDFLCDLRDNFASFAVKLFTAKSAGSRRG